MTFVTIKGNKKNFLKHEECNYPSSIVKNNSNTNFLLSSHHRQ